MPLENQNFVNQSENDAETRLENDNSRDLNLVNEQLVADANEPEADACRELE
ncbi:hypothetical protein [Paenibacillus xerothermodurans]|uniref:hypothetical protein n=1 Tax=Paenibacillus xerothermodurans TaxID=1977292 RepID=UPI001402C3C2|nr:hypothetical protein [Paenibacillus xerothermodurans]